MVVLHDVNFLCICCADKAGLEKASRNEICLHLLGLFGVAAEFLCAGIDGRAETGRCGVPGAVGKGLQSDRSGE